MLLNDVVELQSGASAEEGDSTDKKVDLTDKEIQMGTEKDGNASAQPAPNHIDVPTPESPEQAEGELKDRQDHTDPKATRTLMYVAFHDQLG